MDRIADDEALAAEIRRAIDGKTKPVGALGRIEGLAAQVARVQRSATPRLSSCALTIFAADHGIAASGVSAYPQAVTRQMVANFLAGGAASNVFAAGLGVPVQVVDAGVAGPALAHPRLLSRRIGPGTSNALDGPAMRAGECARALRLGRTLGAGPCDVAAAFGEMGIGNTASAALVAHKLAALPLEVLTGRGTGLDDVGLARKRAVLERAAARTAPRLDPAEALAQYGGFEIAMMAGAMLGAAQAGRIVLVDGFIATVAALVAEAMEPDARGVLVFAHVSAEQGHRHLLDRMGAEPLLDLGMRLGEGTGALLAWPLLRAAVAMLNDMASFESAGVSGPA
jgi:nicotinate-nucleotide--dimethylbenzimidazole phosphoribosyltransferase